MFLCFCCFVFVDFSVQTKQELSHALYQHDAACRVIARLTRERDEARAALTHLRENVKNRGSAMEVDSVESLSSETIAAIEQLAEGLRSGRKKRQISPSLASRERIEAFKQIDSVTGIHSSAHPGLTSLDIHADERRIFTGGVDKAAVLFDRSAKQVLASFKHPKRVSAVRFHREADALFSACDDGVVRVFTRRDGEYVSQATKHAHEASVSGIDIHPIGNLLYASSYDGTWSVHDLQAERAFAVRAENALESIQVHPDGLIVGTGSADKTVRIWDVKTSKNVATLSDGHTGSVRSLSFSENGYYLATADSEAVQLWDLRKPKNFLTLPAHSGGAISSVQFDASGMYLLVAGSELRVFNAKGKFELIKTLTDHEALVSQARFGVDAASIFSASMDRTLRVFA